MKSNLSAKQYIDNADFVAELGEGVFTLLAPKQGESILDIGCGDGALTAKIAASGAQVLGLDYNQNMVNAACDRGLSAQVANAEKLTFNQDYDAVFSNAALHWMQDYQAVIDGVHKALKPGGRFVAEFGEQDNLAGVRQVLRQMCQDNAVFGEFQEPCFHPTVSFYQNALETRGFSVSHIERFERPTPLGAGAVEWLKMYTSGIRNNYDAATSDLFIQKALEGLKQQYPFTEGGWTADFVRLRFCAIKK